MNFFSLPVSLGILCFLLSAPSLSAFENKEKFKAEIALLEQQQLQKVSAEQKAQIKMKLAIAYFLDQEAEKAFKTFLDALDLVKSGSNSVTTSQEEVYYKEALKGYLSHNSGGLEANKMAQQLLKDYEPILESHPDYFQLNFIIAAAYANLGEFDKFFPKFFISYQRNPTCYLAYRTKAVLHIKLFEKARTLFEKNEEAKKICALLESCLNVYPHDASLYKLLLVFSPENDKKRIVQQSLQKILQENIIIPRSEILFYITEALNVEEVELAQRFLDKANKWYQFSRIIQSAQELINNPRNKG